METDRKNSNHKHSSEYFTKKILIKKIHITDLIVVLNNQI